MSMGGDPYKYFRVEARELLDELGKGVLELERTGSAPELVQRLLRLAHTLKGAARVVKQSEIGEHAHAIEDALQPLRDVSGPVEGARVELLLQHLDRIQARLERLQPGAAQAGAPPAASSGDESARRLRADVGELEELLAGIGETHAQLVSAARLESALERSRHIAELLRDRLTAPLSAAGEPAGGDGKLRSLVEELNGLLASTEQGFVRAVDAARRELVLVREGVEQLRLWPARGLFVVLERTARDVAQALGKQVTFQASGGDVRLDPHVIDVLQGALVQIVRNAVAHGIELEADRRAAGKSPGGTVTLEVLRRGRRVCFRCSDDGRGIDLEAVRRAAARRGLMDSEAARLDVNALLRLLLRGGISTSAHVTEIAGRGVGLDVVREAVERLGAELSVRTEAGAGSSFELIVPLSLASVECLLVAAGGRRASIPFEAVRRTLWLSAADVTSTPHGESVVCEGQVLPFVQLGRVLRSELVPAQTARLRAAVVLETPGGAAALGVEQLLGTATVVLRPLPDHAPCDRVVAGISLDAEGNPELVLDPDSLITAARAMPAQSSLDSERMLPILVIDDSMTTRMLEQSILESAGYEVETATSAEQALERAQRTRYALFLVDVEMPGMDGFAFIERIRADPELRHTPAILVTSRAAAEDRERGRAVGADAYIVKSEFDQAELLSRIRQLVR